MPSFFVDDQFHVHRKAEALVDLGPAGVLAVGVWTLVGSMVQAKLADGMVSAGAATRLLGSKPMLTKAAKVLVANDLWHAPGHDCEKCPQPPAGCWVYHDWFGSPMNYSTGAQVKVRRARTQELKRPEIVEAVRARDWDSRCRYCGTAGTWEDKKSDRGLTYDHVYPGLAAGATNLVVACRGCNRRKAARTPEQAGMTLRQPPTPRSSDTPNGLGIRSNPDQIPAKSRVSRTRDADAGARVGGGVKGGVGSRTGSRLPAEGPAGQPPEIPPPEGHTGSPWHGWSGLPPPDQAAATCPTHGLDLPCRTCTADHYATEAT